jgi:hypothetical protein
VRQALCRCARAQKHRHGGYLYLRYEDDCRTGQVAIGGSMSPEVSSHVCAGGSSAPERPALKDWRSGDFSPLRPSTRTPSIIEDNDEKVWALMRILGVTIFILFLHFFTARSDSRLQLATRRLSPAVGRSHYSSRGTRNSPLRVRRTDGRRRLHCSDEQANEDVSA